MLSWGVVAPFRVHNTPQAAYKKGASPSTFAMSTDQRVAFHVHVARDSKRYGSKIGTGTIVCLIRQDLPRSDLVLRHSRARVSSTAAGACHASQRNARVQRGSSKLDRCNGLAPVGHLFSRRTVWHINRHTAQLTNSTTITDQLFPERETSPRVSFTIARPIAVSTRRHLIRRIPAQRHANDCDIGTSVKSSGYRAGRFIDRNALIVCVCVS